MLKALLTTFLLCLNLTAIENDNLIPSNCNTLMGFNVQKIIEIPELKNFLNDKSNTDLQELHSFGLAPENIKSLVIGMDTNKAAKDPMSFQTNPDVLIVATMNSSVNPAKILEKAAKDNVEIKRVNFQGLELSTLKKDGRTMAITKLSDKTLAVGGYTMVKKAIALQKGSSKANINKNAQLTKLIENDKMFWVAGIIPEFPQPGPNDPLSNPTANAASQIKAFTLSGDYQKDLNINANLFCKTVQAAAQLSAMAQLMVGMASANPEFPLKADAIKLTTHNEKIIFNIKLDQESLNKISKVAKENKGILSPGL